LILLLLLPSLLLEIRCRPSSARSSATCASTASRPKMRNLASIYLASRASSEASSTLLRDWVLSPLLLLLLSDGFSVLLLVVLLVPLLLLLVLLLLLLLLLLFVFGVGCRRRSTLTLTGSGDTVVVVGACGIGCKRGCCAEATNCC
jgi:hypothetical protein